MQKIFKYREYIETKFKILYKQQYLKFSGGALKYIHEASASDTLIIVFSARTREGIKARYNYIKTLHKIDAEKLFILDDFSEDKRGAYYLGENMDFTIEEATHKLIKSFLEKKEYKKVVFCGSSKGGWAALNFGVFYENAYIIAGAPQYYLADYLKEHGEVALEYIIDKQRPDSYEVLNGYLKGKLLANNKANTQKIFLHYSDCEHTYEEHIVDLIEDLKIQKYAVEYNLEHYKNHWDISYYFPQYLTQSIVQILKRSY